MFHFKEKIEKFVLKNYDMKIVPEEEFIYQVIYYLTYPSI